MSDDIDENVTEFLTNLKIAILAMMSLPEVLRHGMLHVLLNELDGMQCSRTTECVELTTRLSALFTTDALRFKQCATGRPIDITMMKEMSDAVIEGIEEFHDLKFDDQIETIHGMMSNLEESLDAQRASDYFRRLASLFCRLAIEFVKMRLQFQKMAKEN